MCSRALFWPKMAVFGPKLQFLKLRSATCESRSRPPPLSFLLKLCVIVLHTHRYHPPKFHPNLKHHNGNLIFPHFARAACLLLVACCLLAAVAKPGRCTLDTKKRYKTKWSMPPSFLTLKTSGFSHECQTHKPCFSGPWVLDDYTPQIHFSGSLTAVKGRARAYLGTFLSVQVPSPPLAL